MDCVGVLDQKFFRLEGFVAVLATANHAEFLLHPYRDGSNYYFGGNKIFLLRMIMSMLSNILSFDDSGRASCAVKYLSRPFCAPDVHLQLVRHRVRFVTDLAFVRFRTAGARVLLLRVSLKIFLAIENEETKAAKQLVLFDINDVERGQLFLI